MKKQTKPDAERVRALRKKLGLSQQALAEKLGASFGAVQKWELNRRRPTGLYRKALDDLGW